MFWFCSLSFSFRSTWEYRGIQYSVLLQAHITYAQNHSTRKIHNSHAPHNSIQINWIWLLIMNFSFLYAHTISVCFKKKHNCHRSICVVYVIHQRISDVCLICFYPINFFHFDLFINFSACSFIGSVHSVAFYGTNEWSNDNNNTSTMKKKTKTIATTIENNSFWTANISLRLRVFRVTNNTHFKSQ